jgi:hypothetical protein
MKREAQRTTFRALPGYRLPPQPGGFEGFLPGRCETELPAF